MVALRGLFHDILYGVVYPLADRNLSWPVEKQRRMLIAAYCRHQAKMRKPYNINFLDSKTDKAFYCSQLAYKAYLSVGIDLNTGEGVQESLSPAAIVFPQEIWSGTNNKIKAP